MRLGINLPWLDYGGDFGANAWHPEGGLASLGKQQRLSEVFAKVRVLGLREVRLFVFCDGRTGLLEDDEGTVVGLDPVVFADMDAACALAREHGLALVPVLSDFKLFDPPRLLGGVRTGGRGHLVASEDGRRGFIQEAILPFVSRYGADDAIAAWDLFNEPEWGVSGLGGRFPRATTVAAFRAFLEEIILRIRKVVAQPLTVGLASAQGLPLVRGLELGFLQVHWYDSVESRCPLARPVTEIAAGLPLVLGEFPTRGSRRSIEEILDLAADSGYAAAWAWSWGATDEFTDAVRGAEQVGTWGGSGRRLVASVAKGVGETVRCASARHPPVC